MIPLTQQGQIRFRGWSIGQGSKETRQYCRRWAHPGHHAASHCHGAKGGQLPQGKWVPSRNLYSTEKRPPQMQYVTQLLVNLSNLAHNLGWWEVVVACYNFSSHLEEREVVILKQLIQIASRCQTRRDE